MPNSLSNNLLAELFGAQSADPFLMLITFTHPTIPTPIRLVNNTEDIVSRGETYRAFPVRVVLPADDGETAREVNIELDNVSLELVDEIRAVTSPLDASVEMVLSSTPDVVEVSIGELKLRNVTYDQQRIRGALFLDNFLAVEMTSEKYTPTLYPGLF